MKILQEKAKKVKIDELPNGGTPILAEIYNESDMGKVVEKFRAMYFELIESIKQSTKDAKKDKLGLRYSRIILNDLNTEEFDELGKNRGNILYTEQN